MMHSYESYYEIRMKFKYIVQTILSWIQLHGKIMLNQTGETMLNLFGEVRLKYIQSIQTIFNSIQKVKSG